MSITIENAEVEALLADLTRTTRRTAPDLLLELLRRERERMSDDWQRASRRVWLPTRRCAVAGMRVP